VSRNRPITFTGVKPHKQKSNMRMTVVVVVCTGPKIKTDGIQVNLYFQMAYRGICFDSIRVICS
jgi:hypothetical protein